MILLILSLALLSPHAAAQTPPPPPACLDFTSQAEAQAFYEAQGGPAQDPNGLDPDRDGRACSAEGSAIPTSPSVSMTGTPSVTGTATPAGDDLPPGSSRGPWGWVGLALAAGGAAVTVFSIWRRRRSAPPGPPGPPRLPADAFDELGW
ncbi:MAG: hypothetical protein ACRDKJ_08790 [Actinomycetota bacterium]